MSATVNTPNVGHVDTEQTLNTRSLSPSLYLLRRLQTEKVNKSFFFISSFTSPFCDDGGVDNRTKEQPISRPPPPLYPIPTLFKVYVKG